MQQNQPKGVYDMTNVRTGRELLAATGEFAIEDRAKAWWNLASTAALLALCIASAAVAPWWPARLAASVLAGLLMVRSFVLYHDFMHGSILRDSKFARAAFYAIGVFLLAPPRSWRHSHNFHHGNVGRLDASTVGSFPLITVQQWMQLSAFGRVSYYLKRHPLTILFAYATVFVYSICFESLMTNPKRYWDSAFALACHALLITAVALAFGPAVLVFALLLPMAIASAVGAYLFYAQHNFEGLDILDESEWNYARAAIVSSSFLRTGPITRYFTANIGYHHIHHLNPMIPWYRLPDAMRAIPELQHPVATSLAPRDVLSCLRLKLWDPSSRRMLGFREARALAGAAR